MKTGEIIPAKELSGVLSGEEAKDFLERNIKYTDKSGSLGLYRDTDGGWYAYLYCLAYSSEYGRVDWVCGEATRTDLKQAYSGVNEREFSEKIRKLEAEG